MTVSSVHIRPILNWQIGDIPEVRSWFGLSAVNFRPTRSGNTVLVLSGTVVVTLRFFVYPNSFNDRMIRATRLWFAGSWPTWSLSSAAIRLAP